MAASAFFLSFDNVVKKKDEIKFLFARFLLLVVSEIVKREKEKILPR